MDEYISKELDGLISAIKDISTWDDEKIEETLPLMKENVESNYTPEIRKQSINQLVKNLEDQGLDREAAKAQIKTATEALNDVLVTDDLTEKQKEAVNVLLTPLFETFEEALTRFHLYHIELPLTLDEGAQAPAYAHDTDACADLYALENIVVRAHTYGNKIRTGVKIQLPEGWVAMIYPRSSMGAKTPLRLSNSVGIIDSGYRGELGVLYDNISDHDYEIKAGDRIAQLMVMPSYRFMPKVVDILADSDRGEGGFGSTGA